MAAVAIAELIGDVPAESDLVRRIRDHNGFFLERRRCEQRVGEHFYKQVELVRRVFAGIGSQARVIGTQPGNDGFGKIFDSRE